MVPLLDQFYYFALTILIGMVAGFCYDLYKVTRGTLRLRKVGTALGDALFWLILTGVVFILLLLGNWGEVRLYVLLGLTLGALGYTSICSRQMTRFIQSTFKLLHRLMQLLMKTLNVTWRMICLPFKGLYLMVAIPLGIAITAMGKIVQGVKYICRKLFGTPARAAKKRVRKRFASIFPIFEYKDKE